MISILNNIENKINYTILKAESIKNKVPEVVVIILYTILHIVISIFHEPWNDEAVAWQIAKELSLKTILFETPHYEGHPQLWHLILVPFAKSGAPYELSLLLITTFFTVLTVVIFEKNCPFPRIVKWMLPFGFFPFYQYGVIARPYCMMMLAFVMLASLYAKRNRKVIAYILALIFLCLTSFYGVIFAGGIAIVWVIEICWKRNIIDILKSFKNDRRVWGLCGLLVFAICLGINLIPSSQTYALDHKDTTQSATIEEQSVSESGTIDENGDAVTEKNSLVLKVAYMEVAALSDCFLTNAFESFGKLDEVQFDPYILGTAFIFGVLLWAGIIVYGKRKKTCFLFIIPYTLFAIFCSLMYCYGHHTGLIFLYVIFWLWCSADNGDCLSTKDGEKGAETLSLPNNLTYILRCGAKIIVVLSILLSLYWNGLSCITEIMTDYSSGRGVANFIKDNNLSQYKIMSDWFSVTDEDGKIIDNSPIIMVNANNMAPYFKNNVIMNYEYSAQIPSIHKELSSAEIHEIFEEWESQGTPDILLGSVDLGSIYGDEAHRNNYKLVYEQHYGQIWKGLQNYGTVYIYMRDDLRQELGISNLENTIE